MTVSTSMLTEGTELLTEERIGQPLVVEGLLQNRMITDTRYAVKDTDLGAQRVNCICGPHGCVKHVRTNPLASAPFGSNALS